MNSRLKNLRSLLDYTQKDLAHEFGISRQSLIALERGKCKPSIDLAAQIADFFEMPIELIFPYTRNKTSNSDPAHPQRAGARGDNVAKKTKAEVMPWSGFSPLRELSRMHDEIDRLFEDSFFEGRGLQLSAPAVNVLDKKDAIVVEAALPGVEEKDVEIEVHSGYIKIRGEKKESKEVKKEDYYHRESSHGSFARAVTLPAKVKADEAKARMDNGMLIIELPKKEVKKSKTIRIKPGGE